MCCAAMATCVYERTQTDVSRSSAYQRQKPKTKMNLREREVVSSFRMLRVRGRQYRGSTL